MHHVSNAQTHISQTTRESETIGGIEQPQCVIPIFAMLVVVSLLAICISKYSHQRILHKFEKTLEKRSSNLCRSYIERFS